MGNVVQGGHSLPVSKMLYFIRHAEGEANISERRLGKDTPLTLAGRQQAILLAKHCVKLRAGALLTSPVFRAAETAVYVSQACNLNVIRLASLRERRRPSEVNGILKKSDEAVRINKIIRENFHVPRWRFSDEENFDDLKNRAMEVLKYMESHEAVRIIAISHGWFIRIIIACAILGEELTGAECEAFIRGFRMQKTGIAALSVNHNLEDEGISSKFQLWMWNDYSHLG